MITCHQCLSSAKWINRVVQVKQTGATLFKTYIQVNTEDNG